MKRVLIDSSAFLALEHPKERSHVLARSTLEELAASKAALITTNFIFDETYTLILTRLGRQRAVDWGENCLAGRLVQLMRVDEEQEARAWEIILAFSDKDFSFTDATSFAVAESFGIEVAFSLDRHFREYGLSMLP